MRSAGRQLVPLLVISSFITSCGATLTPGAASVVGRFESAPSITALGTVEEGTVGVTIGPAGEIYLVQVGCTDLFNDSGHRYIPSAVVRFNANRSTTLIAGGLPSCGFSGDGGPAVRANLDEADGIVADKSGNLYVADQYGERVRRITPQGIITTVVGSGPAEHPAYAGDGGPAIAARLNRPCGLAFDTAGNLYISELENNVVRKVTPAGVITTVAGTGRAGFSGDGGPATAARMQFPQGIAVDAAGNLYIADEENHRIRTVTPAGIISTVVGNGQAGSPADGQRGTATSLDYPQALAVAPDGTLFIGDSNGNALLRLAKDGVVHAVDPPHAYWEPNALAFDKDGNLFVIDNGGSARTLYKLTWPH